MKHETLEMYGTAIQIYKFGEDDEIGKNIEAKGLNGEGEKKHVPILKDGEYVEGPRERGSFFAYGVGKEGELFIIAQDIDTKQLANVFLSLGIEKAHAIQRDVSGISFEEIKEDEESSITEETISADNLKEEWLGGPNMVMTSDTIKLQDLEDKPKAKAKKSRGKKKE